MMGWLECIRSTSLVATRADHRLRFEIAHRVFSLMQGMAIRTRHLITRVGIGAPVGRILGVALQALLVLSRLRRIRFLAEANHTGPGLTFSVGMRIAGAMARLAL
jgi:hypothetical protein